MINVNNFDSDNSKSDEGLADDELISKSGEEICLAESSVSKNFTEKNRKLNQSTLAFFTRQSDIKEDNGVNKCILQPNLVSLSPQLPKWSSGLTKYFQFVSNNQTRYKFQCMLCLQNHKTVFITDKGSTSFIRHLNTLHKDEYTKTEELEKSRMKLAALATPGVQPFVRKILPYPRNDPRQKKFDASLMEFILQDTVPFSIVTGAGFKSLINGLDPRLTIPHPSTLADRLNAKFYKDTAKIKAILQKVDDESLHFVIDIWTSQQGQSILGFKVQFIKEWKLQQLTVGFKHFPEAHTSLNIRAMLDNFFGKQLCILPKQIGSVTADNAANILGAFKQKDALPNRIEDSVYIPVLNDDEHEMDILIDEQDKANDLKEAEIELTFNPPEELVDDVCDELESWNNAVIKRNGCLAHLIHLTVKDAIAKSKLLTDLVKKLTEIVSFFHNSPKWTAIFKTKSVGVALIKPTVTRWNSFFQAFKRLVCTKKANIMKAVNDTLCEAKVQLGKKSKIPSPFSDDDAETLACVVELLEPCAILTDDLQSDKVTASIVILGFINAIKAVESVTIDSELEFVTQLKHFKDGLLASLMERFSNNVDTNRRGRKKVTSNVFKSEAYIIAALLDSRIKTTCFDASLTRGSILDGKIPTSGEAVQLLKEVYRLYSTKTPPASQSNDKIVEPSAKKQRSMFELVSNLVSSDGMPHSSVACSEIEDYLRDKIDTGENTDKICPLLYWKLNERKFQVLSKMAVAYLAMPASSGSIERLFSVVSSFGKARNARLLPETAEKLLCCKSFLDYSL